jgi:hypothetical protein
VVPEVNASPASIAFGKRKSDSEDGHDEAFDRSYLAKKMCAQMKQNSITAVMHK